MCLERKGNKVLVNNVVVGEDEKNIMMEFIDLGNSTIVLPYLDSFDFIGFRFIKEKNGVHRIDRKIDCLVHSYLITKTLNKITDKDLKASVDNFFQAKLDELKEILLFIDNNGDISGVRLVKIQRDILNIILAYSIERDYDFKVIKRNQSRAIDELIGSTLYVFNLNVSLEIDTYTLVNDNNIVIEFNEDCERKYKFRFVVISNPKIKKFLTDIKAGSVSMKTVFDAVDSIVTKVLKNRKGAKR